MSHRGYCNQSRNGLRLVNDATYIGEVEAEQLGGLAGDGVKSQENQLGWQAKVTLKQLAKMMVEADLAEARAEVR